MIEEFLINRKDLKRVFLLVDFRHKPTEDDILMYQFLKYYNIPVTLILNKCDKVGSSKHERNLKLIKETIDLEVGDDYIIFSSETKKGRDKVLQIIDAYIEKKDSLEIEEI